MGFTRWNQNKLQNGWAWRSKFEIDSEITSGTPQDPITQVYRTAALLGSQTTLEIRNSLISMTGEEKLPKGPKTKERAGKENPDPERNQVREHPLRIMMCRALMYQISGYQSIRLTLTMSHPQTSLIYIQVRRIGLKT